MVSLEDAVIARLESHGERFEVLVDPDLAAEFRREDSDVSVEDVLAVQEVFRDARKGDKASEEAMRKVFETADPLEVTPVILRRGTIQLTAEQRRQMIEDKRLKIINKIAREAINPQNGLPHLQRGLKRPWRKPGFMLIHSRLLMSRSTSS
jgi:Predicted exosome subunit